MLTCRRFDPTGKVLGTITLDLQKSEVQRRITSALVKADGSASYRDMEKLDAGTIAYGTITKLFSPAEIERAVARRISALEVESEELRELQKVLGEGGTAFADAQGGERARFRTASK